MLIWQHFNFKSQVTSPGNWVPPPRGLPWKTSFLCAKKVISSTLQRDVHNPYKFSLKNKQNLYVKTSYDSKYLPRDVSEREKELVAETWCLFHSQIAVTLGDWMMREKPVSTLQQPDFQAGKFSGSFDPGWKQMKAWKGGTDVLAWHQSGAPAQHNLWNGLKNAGIFLLQLFLSPLLWAPFPAIQTKVPGIRLNPLAANILILLQLIAHSWTKRWSSAMSVVQWNSDFGTLKKATDVL